MNELKIGQKVIFCHEGKLRTGIIRNVLLCTAIIEVDDGTHLKVLTSQLAEFTEDDKQETTDNVAEKEIKKTEITITVEEFSGVVARVINTCKNDIDSSGLFSLMVFGGLICSELFGGKEEND